MRAHNDNARTSSGDLGILISLCLYALTGIALGAYAYANWPGVH